MIDVIAHDSDVSMRVQRIYGPIRLLDGHADDGTLMMSLTMIPNVGAGMVTMIGHYEHVAFSWFDHPKMMMFLDYQNIHSITSFTFPTT
jgi:hypothetical protein